MNKICFSAHSDLQANTALAQRGLYLVSNSPSEDQNILYPQHSKGWKAKYMNYTKFNQSSYNSHQSNFIYSSMLSFKKYLSSSELNTPPCSPAKTRAFPRLQSHIQAGTAVKYSHYRKACCIKITISVYFFGNKSMYQGMSFFFSLFSLTDI